MLPNKTRHEREGFTTRNERKFKVSHKGRNDRKTNKH